MDVTMGGSLCFHFRFAVTLTFLVVYLQGAEIFPTQLRYTGSGFASTMGAIAGIFAPIIAQLVIKTICGIFKMTNLHNETKTETNLSEYVSSQLSVLDNGCPLSHWHDSVSISS